jgi:hypothetical protein
MDAEPTPFGACSACAFLHVRPAASRLGSGHRDRSTPTTDEAEISPDIAMGDWTMKTIIALLTTTVLVAGATTAMAADRQGSDEAAGYALSLQAARGFSGAQTAQGFGGAHASARMPGVVHIRTTYDQSNGDFQLQGR